MAKPTKSQSQRHQELLEDLKEIEAEGGGQLTYVFAGDSLTIYTHNLDIPTGRTAHARTWALENEERLKRIRAARNKAMVQDTQYEDVKSPQHNRPRSDKGGRTPKSGRPRIRN